MSSSVAGEFYPSDQIPRIHHGFCEASHGILIADLNREHQPSLGTITGTGNIATITTRPPRRRFNSVWRHTSLTKSLLKGRKKMWRKRESNPRLIDSKASTVNTQPRQLNVLY